MTRRLKAPSGAAMARDMLPPIAKPYADSAASLARTLAAAGPRPARLAAVTAPLDPAPAPPQAKRLPFLVAGLLLAAAVIALLAPREAITERPMLALLLIGFVLVLDFIRIDVFDRSNVSPASVPAL